MAARIGQQEEHQQLVQKTRKKYKSAFLDNLFLMLEVLSFFCFLTNSCYQVKWILRAGSLEWRRNLL